MRLFTDFVLLSYATGMVLTYNVYFKMQMKKIFCPILFEEASEKFQSCHESSGLWFVLAMNILLIPAILQPTLSRLAYFSAFIILLGSASGIVWDV